MNQIRLDRFLAEAGYGTRKEVKKLLKAGIISVNGIPEKRPELHICPENDKVTVSGMPVTKRARRVLMLNKPQGYVTSTADPRERTVMELLPVSDQDLVPVGRLDKNTEGLLLFTDDGDLVHRLISPAKEIEKEYYAETDGMIDADDIRAFADGVELRDGTKCKSAELAISGKGCRVVVREGKYHQVRRMLASRGKPVTYLCRIREGDLVLGELKKGEFRYLTEDEIVILLKITDN